MLATTKFMLSDDERNYLEGIGITQKMLEGLENEDFDSITNINILIKALFTCKKKDAAWDNIRANLEIIDYKDIFTCPYMEMDRDATDVYHYMYSNNIIDKKSYMYFEALSGELNDWDFWKQEFEGLTTTQILELLHDSFNDIFVQQNVNPYQLGLIHLTDEQNKFIFDRITDNEKVDFIFEDKPCIDVNPGYLQALLLNGNLDSEKSPKYFNILFEVYYHQYEQSENKETFKTDVLFNLMDIMYDYFLTVIYDKSSTILRFNDILMRINIDSLKKIYIIIDWMKARKSIGIAELLIFAMNNPLMLSYPYTITNYITEYIPKDGINISDYLDNSNLGFIMSYIFNPMIDCSDYIIKYPFPSGCAIIYNKVDNMIMIGKKIVPYDNDTFNFIDAYESYNKIDDELFEGFNSEDEYKEFILASKDIHKQIEDFLG